MLSVFPLDVLDEIWVLIESVSEGLLTYSIQTVTINLQSDVNEVMFLVYGISKSYNVFLALS